MNFIIMNYFGLSSSTHGLTITDHVHHLQQSVVVQTMSPVKTEHASISNSDKLYKVTLFIVISLHKGLVILKMYFCKFYPP